MVNDKQRFEIYKIQLDHAEQIEALKEKLRDLVAERDAEIRAVLTKDQQEKLDDVIAKSRESRRKAAEKRGSSVASSKKSE